MKQKLIYVMIILIFWSFLIFNTFVLSEPKISQNTTPKTFTNTWSEANIPTHAFMANSKKPKVCVQSRDIKIFVYMFHYIIPDKFVNPTNKWEYNNSMSPAIFELYLKKLNEERKKWNIDIISMNDLYTAKNSSCYTNKNLVVLTSDDGWDDSYNYLFPLAKKYDIPFNLAIISSKVSKVSSEINNFANEFEIKEMLKSKLITLSSHTVNHFDLRRLDDKRRVSEICDSKKNLENLFWIKINSLVYPSGKFNDDVTKETKECWYSFGFAILNKYFTPNELKNKPFELTRIRVNRDSWIRLFNFDK